MAVKWILDEGDSALARVLIGLASNGRATLHAPDLLKWELVSALNRSGVVTEEQAAAHIEQMIQGEVRFHPTTASLFKEAIRLAWRRRLSIYDATYAALAQSLGCPLLTADQELLRRLAGTALAIPLSALRDAR